MYSLSRFSPFVIFSILLGLIVSSCSQDKTDSMYNPSAPSLATPAVTGVLPAGSAVAGIDTVVLQGTGFSSTLGDNNVFFNSSPAKVIQSSPTQLSVIAPLLVNDSVAIRVAVHGSFDYSSIVHYTLKPAVLEFGVLDTSDHIYALTVDAAGNIYGGLNRKGIESGVLQFDEAGAQSSYGQRNGVDWTDIKFGPGGYMYLMRNFRAIYRYNPGVGNAPALWVAMAAGNLFTVMDFDLDGNLWAGGDNQVIYCIKSDKSVTTYPFVGNIHSIRVFNGYLYFAANVNSVEKIWRAPISSGTLGTPEVYFDFSSAYPANVPLNITFSSDGDMFIGMNSNEGILVVSQSLTYRAPWAVYKDLFSTGVYRIAWGTGGNIYCTTVEGRLRKINITGKTSAPYYGN